MRQFFTAGTAAVLLIVALSACGGGGGSSGGLTMIGGGGGTQQPYEIQIVQPAANGAQVGRPFSITLNFVEPGTSNPRPVFGSEQISASVASGPGALSGTTVMSGTGAASLTFSNLILNTAGAYTLAFNGPNASAVAVTTTFNVGPARDLQFTTIPTDALRNRAFSMTVRTVDPATGSPATQTYPVQITLALASGSGNFSGTLVQTLAAGQSTLTFSNLMYDQVGQITVSASAFGFPTAISSPFNVDGVVMNWATVPANVLVNGQFSLTINLTGQLSGGPISPNISATLTVATGTGQLTGGTTANSSGSTITFSNLVYNQIGAAQFTATSAQANAITTSTINFGVDLTVTATGATVRTPGQAWDPFTFRVVDGTGATWTGAVSALSWQVTNSTGGVVQSSSTGFTAGVASVTPSPINTVGSYTLTGSITSPNAASANIGLTVTNLTYINEPGPFMALKSVRVNNPYSDSVASAAPSTTTGYALAAGSLPPGLTLNTTNGAITGTPTTAGSYAFAVHAILPGSQAQRIRCALAVFTANETEIVSGQNFGTSGPYSVTGPVTENFSFTSTYDGINFPQSTQHCRLHLYYPNFAAAPSPAPVYIHHRGRGFNMASYNTFANHVASHGIIFISVEDSPSFSDGGYSGQAPISTYDSGAAERGMQSASAFQEAVLNWVTARNQQTGHALHNRVDVERIFTGGHSRGGGATHGSHVRSAPYTFNGTQRQSVSFRGVIYFMAFDLRYFSSTVAGSTVVYPVASTQPRLPSLVIAAENDGDLYYPICDQFIDRADGPTTHATIYGGVHAFLSDTGTYDAGAAYISRAQQMARMFNLVIAFIKRWSNLDLSLEGLLYGNEYAGSSEVAITSWRNMAERVLVDNHQNGSANTNTLGGANSITTGGTISVSSSIYTPNVGNMSSLNLRHLVATLQPNSNVTYTANIPAASQDMSRTRRLIFRTGTIDASGQSLKGFDWVTVRVRLADAQNDQATVTLFDRTNPSTTYLPDYPGGGSNVYDRFVEASVMLSTFTSIEPQLNLNQLQRIELIFETAAGVSRQIYFDDFRFE